MTEFKDKLKELRHSQNYTQKELGELLYVSRSTVAKWEAGLVFPADEYLDRLCEVFGVGREAFFRDAEQEKLNSKKNRTISKQKRLIFLMSGALAILLFAIVYFTVNSAVNFHTSGPEQPTNVPAPTIRLNEGDEYLDFGVTRPDERDGQMEVYVVTNILTKEVLRRMTVNPIPDGGRITLTTDFAPESVAAYYFEVTDEFLYLTEDGVYDPDERTGWFILNLTGDGVYDPDERTGWFSLDLAAPLTVTGSAPAFTVTLPEEAFDRAEMVLVRIEITVRGDTFRYFALY